MMGGAEGVLTEGPSSQNCPGSPFYSLLGEKMGFFFFFLNLGIVRVSKTLILGKLIKNSYLNTSYVFFPGSQKN